MSILRLVCKRYKVDLAIHVNVYDTLVSGLWARGGDLVLSLPGCVCPKVKDMGPFWASRE